MSPRSVLITGASGGLGSQACHTFLEAGYTVVGVANSGGLPAGVLQVKADLTKKEGAEAVVAEAMAKTGHIDAVAHLMGAYAGGAAVEQIDDAAWAKMLALNLHSAFFVLRAVLPQLIEQQSGRIVTIGSRPALEPVAGLAAYSVAKAGLIALTKTIAAEGKMHGITANVVVPGVIDTAANRAAMPDADFSQWVAPEAMARLILFLCSEPAGDVTGTVIPM